MTPKKTGHMNTTHVHPAFTLSPVKHNFTPTLVETPHYKSISGSNQFGVSVPLAHKYSPGFLVGGCKHAILNRLSDEATSFSCSSSDEDGVLKQPTKTAEFLPQLCGAIRQLEYLMIISDRNVSIIVGMEAAFPSAAHGFCEYHLSQNLRKACRVNMTCLSYSTVQLMCTVPMNVIERCPSCA
ncbi:hypothetical protein ACOSQ3_029303 [Xanthoceras sorbifolium]